jgi:hypothetical protein
MDDAPPATLGQNDPTLERLESEIEWYDRKSGINQQRFKVPKSAQLVAAGAIPFSAALDANPALAAGLEPWSSCWKAFSSSTSTSRTGRRIARRVRRSSMRSTLAAPFELDSG